MLILAAVLFVCQVDRARPAIDDIDSSLDSVRRQLADDRRPLDQRASLALDEAALIDRIAQGSPDVETRRARMVQAVNLLDDFNAAHPGHPLATPLALQAAVYVWAEGRRELDAWRLATSNADLKHRARERLDQAIGRIDRLAPGLSGTDPLIAQNARFRLAQAHFDHAGLDMGRPELYGERLRRALAALDPIPVEPSITGYARQLRGQVLTQLGDFETAEDELEKAASSKFPPPIEGLTDARADALIGQNRYSDAVKMVDASGLDAIGRAAIVVRIRLAQRRHVSAGTPQVDADTDAFARAALLRHSSRLDARLALNDLARHLDEPPRRAEPDDWDLLAEGAIGLGDFARASRLVIKAADRAAYLNRFEEAGKLRFRAGAILFQADELAGAEAVLAQVAADPKAGPSRPKAGMLRALALGKALAQKRPEVGRSAYLAALRDQVREFGGDPTTNEARWLLGAVEGEDGRATEAVALWKVIPAGHPRWLLARLAIAGLMQRELDDLRIANDPPLVRAKYRETASFLRQSINLARTPADGIELELAAARLDLTPGVGRPELARSLCERLNHQAGPEGLHARVKMLHVVALALSQRFPEAEQEARDGMARGSIDDWLLAARLIDHTAGENDSDVARGRYGRLLRLVADGVVDKTARSVPAIQVEAKLRSIRASIYLGDNDLARRGLRLANEWDPETLDIDLLRDLGDAFMRLEGYGVAVDVERILARRLKPGSLRWLEARYILALADFQSHKVGDARKVVEATAILHPELGGGSLKDRFERLRQKIDQE